MINVQFNKEKLVSIIAWNLNKRYYIEKKLI